MAREDYGKLFFCCSAFLVSSRPVFGGFAIRVLCKAQPIPGFDSGATVVLVPKPVGRVSASLRRAGLRLARLNAGVYLCKPRPPEHLFPLPFRVAASCLFQSAAEFANNVQVMGISRSLALRPGRLALKARPPQPARAST